MPASRSHHALDMAAQPEHAKAREELNRHNPRLATAKPGAPDGIDKRTPQQLQRVRVRREAKDANLAVRHVVLE